MRSLAPGWTMPPMPSASKSPPPPLSPFKTPPRLTKVTKKTVGGEEQDGHGICQCRGNQERGEEAAEQAAATPCSRWRCLAQLMEIRQRGLNMSGGQNYMIQGQGKGIEAFL
ncbi:uncharacterized protein [Lolium perenne]|uniref:uncharacterized protein n=1 Tax=Lolium perenne TaxID=4522 RepID=UPI003A98D154